MNTDFESPHWDLKWTLKHRDIDYNSLKSKQKVNHFNRIASIVTKSGLTASLKNLIWFRAVDINTFYPRCFDLSGDNPEEMNEFIEEFKMTKA